MRQAGRSLPEYRELRKGSEMLEACLNPQLAYEITMQPVRRHNVDAAIFFSDIVVPLKLAGVEVEIQPGIGPVIANPVRTEADFEKLQRPSMDAMAPIQQAVALVVAELKDKPLIGFGGAPFTVASYLIEGGPSRDFPNAKKMMEHNPDLWRRVLTWCADVTAMFIRAQVEAGASALQVFDSWAGRLTPEVYEEFAAPFTAWLFAQLTDLQDGNGVSVPRIHFGVETENILIKMNSVGGTVLGIDAHTSLEKAAKLFPKTPLQGNIDPEILQAEWSEIQQHVLSVLKSGEGAISHVVNLGHGVPKDTDPDVLTKIVSLVHEASR